MNLFKKRSYDYSKFIKELEKAIDMLMNSLKRTVHLRDTIIKLILIRDLLVAKRYDGTSKWHYAYLPPRHIFKKGEKTTIRRTKLNEEKMLAYYGSFINNFREKTNLNDESYFDTIINAYNSREARKEVPSDFHFYSSASYYQFQSFMLDHTQVLDRYFNDIFSHKELYSAIASYMNELLNHAVNMKTDFDYLFIDEDFPVKKYSEELKDFENHGLSLPSIIHLLKNEMKDIFRQLKDVIDKDFEIDKQSRRQISVDNEGLLKYVIFLDFSICKEFPAPGPIKFELKGNFFFKLRYSRFNEILTKLDLIYELEQRIVQAYIRECQLVETHVHAHLGLSTEAFLRLLIANYDKVKSQLNNYEGLFKNKLEEMLPIVSEAKRHQENFTFIAPIWVEEFSKRISLLPEKNLESFKLFSDYCNFIDDLLAISELDHPEETSKVYAEMCKEMCNKGIEYAELRKNLKNAEVYYDVEVQKKRLLPIIHGIEQAERELKEEGKRFRAFVILGLRRFKNHEAVWQTITEIIKDETFKTRVCGVDFNGDESFDNPAYYKGIFKLIQDYNKKAGSKYRLGITFHSGEIYDDRSLEAAIRWIHELADLGVDRVGHANILGITNFDRYKGKLAPAEPLVEVRNQAEYDIKNRKGLMKFGVKVDENAALQKIRIANDILSRYGGVNVGFLQVQAGAIVASLMNNENSVEDFYKDNSHSSLPDVRPQPYTDDRINEIKARQAYVLSLLKKKKVIIETNPTSNVALNYDITAYTEHPIRMFLQHRIKFSINTDDPLIFDSDLLKEYSHMIQHLRLKSDQIAKIIKDSKESAFRY